MASIREGYFTINDNKSVCVSSPYDIVKVECRAIFDFFQIGQQMKAELKILLSDNTTASFYTGYQTVGLSNELVFTTEPAPTPLPTGTYKTAWFVVYDFSGNIVTQGDGKGYGLCESITVTNCPRGTRYARGLFGDCDKGYYQCDELVTGYCCCGEVPPSGIGSSLELYLIGGALILGVVGTVYVSSKL